MLKSPFLLAGGSSFRVFVSTDLSSSRYSIEAAPVWHSGSVLSRYLTVKLCKASTAKFHLILSSLNNPFVYSGVKKSSSDSPRGSLESTSTNTKEPEKTLYRHLGGSHTQVNTQANSRTVIHYIYITQGFQITYFLTQVQQTLWSQMGSGLYLLEPPELHGPYTRLGFDWSYHSYKTCQCWHVLPGMKWWCKCACPHSVLKVWSVSFLVLESPVVQCWMKEPSHPR